MPGPLSIAHSRSSSLIVLLALLNMAATTDRMIFAALAPVLQPALHLSDAQLGLVQGPAFGVTYGVALPFAGRLVDVVGGRRAIIGAVLVWALGMVASAAAGGLALLVVGRAITGVGQAVLTPAALTLILERVAPARAGRSISLFTGAGTVGRASAFAIAGTLLAWFDHGARIASWPIASWSAVLLILAVATLLMLAIGNRVLHDERTMRSHNGFAPLRRWLRAAPAPIALAVVAALGSVVAVQALAAWVAIVMVRGLAMSPALAGIAIGLVGFVAGPLGHLFGGIVADRTPRIGVGQAIMALLCVPATLLFVHAAVLPLACIGLMATTLSSGAAATIGLVRVQRLIPADVRGSANGLFMALVALIGISGGPTLVALIADGGAGIAGGLVLVVAGSSALTAIAALVIAGPPAP